MAEKEMPEKKKGIRKYEIYGGNFFPHSAARVKQRETQQRQFRLKLSHITHFIMSSRVELATINKAKSTAIFFLSFVEILFKNNSAP